MIFLNLAVTKKQTLAVQTAWCGYFNHKRNANRS